MWHVDEQKQARIIFLISTTTSAPIANFALCKLWRPMCDVISRSAVVVYIGIGKRGWRSFDIVGELSGRVCRCLVLYPQRPLRAALFVVSLAKLNMAKQRDCACE